LTPLKIRYDVRDRREGGECLKPGNLVVIKKLWLVTQSRSLLVIVLNILLTS
jgi:hypothetical protein